MRNALRHVSTIGLLLPVVGAIAAPAAAQSGPWRPEPTVGIAVGVSDDGNWAGDGKNLLVSGTYELPILDVARIRVEAARTGQAIRAPRSVEGDTAHISRLTAGLAAINRSAAPLMPYGGIGIGLYHATFDRAPATGWRRGGYLHAGIEVQVTDAIAVNTEVALHVVPQSLYPGGALRGELVLRVKFGLSSPARAPYPTGQTPRRR